MKKFKFYDMWISIILMAVFTLVSLIRLDATFIIGYFTVGAWQIISMLVHYYNKWFVAGNTSRSYYHKFILWMAVALAVSFVFTTITIAILFALLFTAPVLAFIYTFICYEEVYIKMQRPLALLK